MLIGYPQYFYSLQYEFFFEIKSINLNNAVSFDQCEGDNWGRHFRHSEVEGLALKEFLYLRGMQIAKTWYGWNSRSI